MNNNEKQPKVTVDYIKKVLGTSSTGTVKNPSNNRATYDLLNKVTNTVPALKENKDSSINVVPALDVSSTYDSRKNISNSSNTVPALQSGTPQYINADVKDITSKAGKTIRDGINYKGDTFLGEQELARRGKEINSANITIPFLQVASNVFGKFGSNPISNYFDNKIAEQQEKIDSAKDLSKYSSQQIKDAYDGIRNYSGVERTLLDFDGSKSALNTMKQAMTPEYNENLRRDVINSLVSSNSLEQFKTAYAPTNTIQEGFLFSGIGDDIVASDSQKNLRKLLANKTGYSEEDLRSVAEYLLKNNAMDSIAEYADEHPVIASAFSVPVNLVGHLQGAANSAISGITGSPIDSEGMGYSLQDMSNTARQTVSDNIENPLGKFVYGTGMSMADSLAAMVIGGGNPAVTSAIMATGAYSETAQEGAERGLTPSQIQTTAIAAGAFEYLFEKISWDKLNLIAKGEASKNILANIATQAVTEGAEEVGTDFANMLVDNLVNGGAAEMVKLHDFYMEYGMTDSEAQAEVMKQMAKQLVSSFAGGALSGGVMGGGASVVSRVTGRNNGNTSIDNTNTEIYNNNVNRSNVSSVNGGNIDGSNQNSGTGTSGIYTGRTESGTEYGRGNESGRSDSRGDTGISSVFRITEKVERQKLNSAGITDNEFRNTSSNPELFSFALESGKNSNPNGVMVDSHTAQELRESGAKTFLSKDNMAGGAVMPDGNITAVFKNANSASKRAGVDITITAIANGGNKLDCYGNNLLKLYSRLGFEPVAKVKFNTKYAPDGWNYEKFGMPDIYVMKHNGKSVSDVVDDYVNGTFRNFSKEEIDALPYMEYDAALKYRDSLISNNRVQNNTNDVNTQQKIRGYNDSITEKSDLPDDIKNEFISNPQYYEVLSNKTTLENANRIIDSTDSNGALSQFNRLLDQKNPTAIPLGYNLSKQLRQEGRFDEAVDVLRRMSEKLTESGQFSQAAAITLMNNDPDMALKYVIREIDNLNAKGREKYKGKWVDFELTESEKQAFSKLEAGDAEGIKSVYNSIFERIQRQYPSTMKEKLLEFRRVSMLLNVRTNVRNVVSNAMLMPVRWTADRVSALGQNFLKLMNPDAKTTQAVIVNKKAKALAKEAWSTVSDTILGSDGKYEDVKGAIRNKQVFKGGKIASFIDNVTNGAITKLNQMMGKDITPSITETLRNFTYWLLQKGDDGFVRMNFESRMASYIAAQKITDLESIPADAYTLATQEAMKATFKDDTALARMLQNVKQNTGIVGEVVLPFTKTPANLAMRGYDYSIGGYVDALKTWTNKNRTWNDVTSTMDNISKSVVGTAAIAVGYALAKAGLITGPLSDDKDEEMFQRAMGMLPYAIKIGQNYYSYDWAQPAAIPIIFGATIYNASKESDTALNAFKQGGLAAIDSWFNLSPLQNVQDIFGGYGTPAENITDVMIQSPLSFIPAQLGALARTADTTQRVTYSDNTFEYLKNSAMSKVPFLSEQLPASYDTWGNEIKRSDSTGEAAFAQLINPGQVGNSNVTPIDGEITRLFESTGDSAVFPRKAEWDYKINGESVKLDNEQYSEMQRMMGELSYNAAEYFISSDLYDKLSDDQKVSMMKDIYSFAQANAMHELLEYDIAGNNTYKKAYNAYEQGGVEDLVNFFYIKTALNGESTIAATIEVIDSMQISDADKGYYLSQKRDLSQAAQEAFQNSGYAGVYQYYSEKVAAEKEKEISSGKITQEYIHNVLTGNKPKITLEYIHNVLNGSN